MSSSCSRRPSHRRARGQGLVEFAVVAPILIALVFGVFDFGRAMSANVTVTNSSREGARYLIANVVSSGLSSYNSCQASSGATSPSSSSGEGAAWRQLKAASLDLSQLSMNVYFYRSTNDPANDGSSNHSAANLSVSCPVGSTGTPTITGSYTPASDDWVVFVTTYLYHPTTPFISQLIGTVTVTQATTMVIE
ncbi:MAG: TadE/TadG family type IV pilus assembly protein [Candidatus Dormibacteria bacterium]